MSEWATTPHEERRHHSEESSSKRCLWRVHVPCYLKVSSQWPPQLVECYTISLLQPLDRYRTPSAIESVIGRPYLALSRTHTQVGVLDRLVLNSLGGSTCLKPFKTSAKQEREGVGGGCPLLLDTHKSMETHTREAGWQDTDRCASTSPLGNVYVGFYKCAGPLVTEGDCQSKSSRTEGLAMFVKGGAIALYDAHPLPAKAVRAQTRRKVARPQTAD